jgi:small subunit ribosomal protein S4
MARYRGPKFKLSRREGVNVTGTTSPRLADVINLPPGRATKPRRKQSDYGVRLRAKQRVRSQYGTSERALRRTYLKAARMKGPTGFNLLQLLERRLDNVVYRLSYARTRPMARQLVGHGHVRVNGRRLNVASYLVEPGDVVQLDQSAVEIPVVHEELASPRNAPSWLQRDGPSARVTGLPMREDIDADIREDLIVEFYAR